MMLMEAEKADPIQAQESDILFVLLLPRFLVLGRLASPPFTRYIPRDSSE
jgi:hypothetical protein